LRVHQQQHRTLILPDLIPLFPLSGALLLPGGQLPLNIFEPRYLYMVDDALAGARMIGMIQPIDERPSENEALFNIGCAGRITSFAETGDGRYMITLTGIHRFKLDADMSADTPYRQGQADWSAFAHDAKPDDSVKRVDRAAFMSVMRRYLTAEGLNTDWDAAQDAPIEALVASLAMGCPFAPNEKQALLEAATIADRADCLMVLMQMSTASDPGDQMLQ